MSFLFDEVFLWKFFKFGVVGFSGVFVDFGFTWLAKEKLLWDKYLANSLGFLTASSTNWYFNRIWTFESADPAIALQYGKFIFVAFIGLMINNAAIWVMHSRLNMNFYLAKLFAIGVAMLWNFAGNYLYTFG